jgi:hypothetical protein
MGAVGPLIFQFSRSVRSGVAGGALRPAVAGAWSAVAVAVAVLVAVLKLG